MTSCDLEPIARPERIQSFGFLLAMSTDGVIVRASANTERFIGVAPEVAIGKALDASVDIEACRLLWSSPPSTIIAAFHALDAQSIDFAVLEINIGGEHSFDLASRLRQLAIPFVIASGYSENINLGSALHSTLTVSKPYDRDDLRFAINQTLKTA